ncbi:MAG: hypothetical protein JWP12_3309 [Bacteroidetes bacterium]|nr:hypothetical protein [Bacteroidota bacterium]
MHKFFQNCIAILFIRVIYNQIKNPYICGKKCIPMKYPFIFIFLLFPFCIHAQLSGRIDSLGRKQGKFPEKMLFNGYPDSLNCIVRYQDGKRAADCDCVFENGTKAVTGDYISDGVKDNVWDFYNPDGSINYRTWYEKGEVLDTYYYVYEENEINPAKKQLQQVIHKDKNDSLTEIEYYENGKLLKTYHASNGRTIMKPVGFVNLRGEWAVTTGYTYQKNHWLELGVKKFSYSTGTGDIDDIVAPQNYLAAGVEIGTDKNKKTELAPKIGVGGYGFVCCNFNLNCILYNDQFQKFYPAITPEIGFSLPYGILQVDYGYNIFLTPNKFMPNETHKISVHITIPFFRTGY